MIDNHPNPCVECKKLGCPTEGMTGTCSEPTCGKTYCFGHAGLHHARHNRCFCGEKNPCLKHKDEKYKNK